MAGSTTRDDRYADYNEICAIELPQQTKTYEPVPNRRMVDTVKQAAQSSLNLPMLDEKYILSGKDQVLIGMLRFETEVPNMPLTVLLRNSYNKKASAAIASGPSAQACSNLTIFSGDICHIRKHTRNVWIDFMKYVNQVMGSAKQRYDERIVTVDEWKAQGVSKQQGYDLFGRAYGNELLKPTMFTEAVRHWNDPPEAFRDEANMWGWYNACTWAIGQKAPADKILGMSSDISEFTSGLGRSRVIEVAEAK
jgi:hypothetical protein